MDERANVDPETHRALAIATNGRAWQLIEQVGELSANERDELLDAAHSSSYHWKQVGTEVHQLRAQWLIARAHAELGHGSAALRHAQRCFDLTEAAGDQARDFDRAYASEALARANAICGQIEKAHVYYSATEQIIAAIATEGDREQASADLTAGNWGSFCPPSDGAG